MRQSIFKMSSAVKASLMMMKRSPPFVCVCFKNFNWRIIALQNFVVFCHSSTRISHKFTHVPSRTSLPSPAPSHPSAYRRAPVWVPWVIQQIPIGCLFYIWSCEFLSYSFHITHLLPPLLPPSIGLFFMSVSPLLSWKWIHQCLLFSFHIYVSVYDIYIYLSDFFAFNISWG